jgi:hypothetical protein
MTDDQWSYCDKCYQTLPRDRQAYDQRLVCSGVAIGVALGFILGCAVALIVFAILR